MKENCGSLVKIVEVYWVVVFLRRMILSNIDHRLNVIGKYELMFNVLSFSYFRMGHYTSPTEMNDICAFFKQKLKLEG